MRNCRVGGTRYRLPLAAAAFATLLLGQIASPAAAGWFKQQRDIMGTRVSIELWHENETTAGACSEKAFAEMRRIEALMSTYRGDSEISYINNNAAVSAVPVSDEMALLLERSGLSFGARVLVAGASRSATAGPEATAGGGIGWGAAGAGALVPGAGAPNWMPSMSSTVMSAGEPPKLMLARGSSSTAGAAAGALAAAQTALSLTGDHDEAFDARRRLVEQLETSGGAAGSD